MDNLVGSTQGKAIIVLALVGLVLGAMKYGLTTGAILATLIVSGLIAFNATCLVKGGCNIWSWITVSLPLLLMVIAIVGMTRDEPKKVEEVQQTARTVVSTEVASS